ncbi:hypothetical protein [Macrococcus brunensis]|uniref:hypothetical protein n=1 Tax=Macrococcus brunensis TaxID=198483 RepID=UPI001EF0AF07|nr:hypothetical protein [Macrococcus brunensis]ULG72990.1 hypothetical protein MGG12_05595 [Macrococcus brunensis]
MTDQTFRVRKDGKYLVGFGHNDEAHPLWLADGEWAKLFTEAEADRIAEKVKGEKV